MRLRLPSLVIAALPVLGSVPATAAFDLTEMPLTIAGTWPVVAPTRGVEQLREVTLAAHNAARAEAGSRPLEWDPALEASAAAYAAELAETGRFTHAVQSIDRWEGENLWKGTRDAFSYADMARHWIDERRDYRPGTFPEVSRTGAWQHVGHYTQVIWSGTRAVGCATAQNAREEVLVCRYWPAGNVMGRAPVEIQMASATSLENASAR